MSTSPGHDNTSSSTFSLDGKEGTDRRSVSSYHKKQGTDHEKRIRQVASCNCRVLKLLNIQSCLLRDQVNQYRDIYTNKTHNKFHERSFIQFLVSQKEIVKGHKDHNSHEPGKSISYRGSKSTIQAASSRSKLPPAPPRQPTPHPNPSQAPHKNLHRNSAYANEGRGNSPRPPVESYRSRRASQSHQSNSDTRPRSRMMDH